MRMNPVFRLTNKSSLVAATISLILLSPYTYLLFNYIGAYLFELAIFVSAAIAFASKSNISRVITEAVRASYVPLILSSLIIALALVVGYANYGNFIASYTDARANLFVVIGFLLFGGVIKRSPNTIVMLAFHSTLFTLVYWLHQYLSEALSSKFAFAIFAPVIGVLVSVKLRNIPHLLFFSLSLLFLCAISGFRQYWIIGVLTLIYASGAILTEADFKTQQRILFAGALSLTVFFGGHFIWAYLSSDESKYIQSIGKGSDLFGLLRGDAMIASDSLRLSYLIYIYENWSALILPHGLGYEAIGHHVDAWFYRRSEQSSVLDSGILFVAYQYGLMLLIPVMLYILWCSLKSMNWRSAPELITLYLIFLTTFTFDGGQLTVTMRAFWFGAFVCYLTHIKSIIQLSQILAPKGNIRPGPNLKGA